MGRPLASNNLERGGGEIEADGPAVFGGYEKPGNADNLTSGKYLSTGDVGNWTKRAICDWWVKGRPDQNVHGLKDRPAAIEQKLVKYLERNRRWSWGKVSGTWRRSCYDGGDDAGTKDGVRG
ncbi:MAG: hypothetical protein IPN90_02680 [Elusimicrobia bacterium]|nr:hypothetical protein [Elusimicrobiota bacterium]